jgi:hypothetical protein
VNGASYEETVAKNVQQNRNILRDSKANGIPSKINKNPHPGMLL